MLLACSNHEIVSVVLLQHQPLHLDVIPGVAPVPQSAQIAEVNAVLQPERYASEGAGDLAGNEGLAAHRAFVVEQDAVAGVHAVGLPVVHRDPVRIQLGHGVGATGVERCRFALRCFLDQSVKLTGAGLIEARLFLQPEDADRLQQAQRAQAVGVGRVLGRIEADRHMTLRSQVVDLVGLHLLHDADQVRRVGHITIVEDEVAPVDMRILIEAVDPVGVEQRRTALDAVNFITLAKQGFGKVGPVLSGDTGDERDFGGHGVDFLMREVTE